MQKCGYSRRNCTLDRRPHQRLFGPPGPDDKVPLLDTLSDGRVSGNDPRRQLSTSSWTTRLVRVAVRRSRPARGGSISDHSRAVQSVARLKRRQVDAASRSWRGRIAASLRRARLSAERDALAAVIPPDPGYAHHTAEGRVRRLTMQLADLDKGEGWGVWKGTPARRPPSPGAGPRPSTAPVAPKCPTSHSSRADNCGSGPNGPPRRWDPAGGVPASGRSCAGTHRGGAARGQEAVLGVGGSVLRAAPFPDRPSGRPPSPRPARARAGWSGLQQPEQLRPRPLLRLSGSPTGRGRGERESLNRRPVRRCARQADRVAHRRPRDTRHLRRDVAGNVASVKA